MHVKKHMALLDETMCGYSVIKIQIMVQEQIIKWLIL